MVDRTPTTPGLPGLLRPADGRPAVVPRRLVPSPRMRAVVDMFWSVAWDLAPGDERTQDVLVHPCGHLTAEADRSTITGVTTHRFRRTLAGTGRVVGVRFAPAGLSSLVDVPMHELTDRSVPAADLLGADAHAALVRAAATPGLDDAVAEVERLLGEWCRPPAPGAELVDRAVRHVHATPALTRVDELAAAVGVGVRTLQRRFDRYLGVGPKWVIQRRRMHDALAEIDRGRAVDWPALAHRLGFPDQPAFTNAFTAATGRPPTTYEARG